MRGSWASGGWRRVGGAPLLAVAVLGAVAVVLFVAASIAAPRAAEAAGSPVGAVPPGQEVASLRTRTSDTYARADGLLEAKVHAGSINYRDASGTWQPIDNTLTAVSGGGFENRANSYRLQLPHDLAAPVRFTLDGEWVQFSLDGSHALGSAVGTTDTFKDAFPGVDVAYSAGGDLVKESLTLASAAAPSSFSFTLRTSPGITPRQNAVGGIDFVDSAGKVRFSFTPPSMQDAAGAFSPAVSYTLTAAPGGYSLGLSADRSWLASPQRSWPVVIDPSVSDNVPSDTFVCSGSYANTNYGTSAYLRVGYDSTCTRRALLKFLIDSDLPPGAEVLDADLALYLKAETTTSAATINAYSLGAYSPTKAWTELGATWNKFDGTQAWATPGGDFDPMLAGSNGTVGGTINKWYHWNLTRLAAAWEDGTAANNGVILKEPNEGSVTNMLSFVPVDDTTSTNYPTLTVVYEAGMGERSFETLDSQSLSDRMHLSANVADGNLVACNNDLQIAGTGLDLSLDRCYNSLPAPYTNMDHFDGRWVMTPNEYLYLNLTQSADGLVHAVSVMGDTGWLAPFTLNSDGSYTAPTGVDATLVKNGDGSYTLTEHATGNKYNFASNGLLSSETDQNGNTISYSHNANGSLASITDTQGRAITFSYDGSNRVSKITDSTGRVNQYAYDASGNLSTYTDPAGKVTSYGYDSNHLLTQITDPRGNQTTLGYDPSAQVRSITRPTNPTTGSRPTTTFTYYATSTDVVDPNGNKTTYSYQYGGNRVTQVTDPLNHTTTANWQDAAYNQTPTSNSPNGKDDNAQKTTGAATGTTNFGYDPTGEKLTSTTAPTGANDTLSYGDSAHPYYPTTETDAQNRTWTNAYDPKGNLSTVTDGLASQNQLKFSYNPNGTVATATDQNGNLTSYGYDGKGNLTTVTRPAPLGTTTYTYDALSRIATITDGKNQTTSYGYDPLDRVASITYNDGSSVNYAYDANGNRTSTTDANGTSTFSYDPLNQLTGESYAGGANPVSYGYDNNGNLTSYTDNGGSTSYLYDAGDQLTSLTDPTGAKTSFQYDADGNRTETDYPNGVSLYTTYDNSGRISTIIGKKVASGTVLSSYSYSYKNGTDTSLIQSVTDYVTGKTTSYSYDALNRLTEANTAGGSDYKYTYDGTGNMLSKTINGVTTNYSYNAANELTGSGYAYDANGNMTQDGPLTLAYNAKNQTSSITNGGTTTNMSYWGAGQAQRKASGSTSYTDSQLGTSGEGSPWTYYTRDPAGTLFDERNAGGNYYPLYDALGSVVAMTDATGAAVATYTYDPYGNTISSTGTLNNPIRYAGGYYDTTSGLYKFGERYYDPTVGRWTQQDPLTDPTDEHGWNSYAYASGDPVNFTDVQGTFGLPHWAGTALHAIRKAFTLHSIARVTGTVGMACGIAALYTAGTIVGFDICTGVADGISAFTQLGDAMKHRGRSKLNAALAAITTFVCDLSIRSRPVFGRACGAAAGYWGFRHG